MAGPPGRVLVRFAAIARCIQHAVSPSRKISPPMPVTTTEGVSRWCPVGLFWAGLLALVVGLVQAQAWQAVSLGSRQLLVLVLLTAALAALLRWPLRWTMTTAVLAVSGLALLVLAGPLACLVVVLLALAALSIGSWLVPAGWEARLPLSVVMGLAVLAGLDGWLLPFRIHYRWVYLLILLGVIALRWRAVLILLKPLPARWSAAVGGARGPAALAMLAVFAASAFAWLPTSMYDDLAYHLGLPSQLAQLAYYRMDVASNVWALAPWAGDVVQGMAQVLAGREARGAVDMLWFGLSCALLWSLCRSLALSPARRWLGLALLASLPLTGALLHSMQTEVPTLTVMLALVCVIVTRPGREARAVLVIGLLVGLLLGLKVSNLWFAGPLGLWWLLRHRGLPGWRGLPLALVCGLLVAGSSYVYAGVLTGNPVLPLFNGWFQSPWFAAGNFHDARWDTGFVWSLPWDLVFHAGRYLETRSIGPLVLIGLAGSFLVALVRPRARPLALVALLCLLLPLSQIQYARYVYPAVALLIPVLLCGLPAPLQRWHGRALSVALWSLVVLGVLFAGSVDWQVKTGALGTRLTAGKAGVITDDAPMRQVLAALDHKLGPAARVLILDADAPFAAELAGRAFVVNWYDPQLEALANKARASDMPVDWDNLLDRSGVNALMLRAGKASPGLEKLLGWMGWDRAEDVHGFAVWYMSGMRAGVTRERSDKSLQVDFDVFNAPPGSTLALATLPLYCRAPATLDITWQAVGTHGHKSEQGTMTTCLPDEPVHVAAHVQVPGQLQSLQALVTSSATVRPGRTRVSLRHDLYAERNLAAHINSWYGIDTADRDRIRWLEP